MKMRYLVLGMLCWGAIGLTPAAQSVSSDVELETARKTAVFDGNLKAAIEQYKRIAERYATLDRAAAAEALLRTAESYRKLGDPTSRQVYEQVARTYGDLPAAAVARTQLGTGGRVPSERAVWTGPEVDPFGQVSPDGRSLTYVDWGHAMNLMVRDLSTNRSRALTNLTPFVGNPSWKWHGEAGASTISKDGRQVAYAWQGPPDAEPELRLLPLTATPETKPRILLRGRPDIAQLQPHDWSPDGQWVVTALSLRDGSGQIALISTTDGSVRVIRSVPWRGPGRIAFSPDGRSFAYDLPASEDTDQRDIYLMSIEVSQEVRVVAHAGDDRLLGWSPDGTRLLFGSDRTGAAGLWAQPFAEGRPNGAPVMLRGGAQGMPLGVSNAGTVYLFKGIDDRQISMASVDLAGGTLSGPPREFDRGAVGGATVPDWSPDGRYLASQYNDGDPSRAAIVIRTVATGAVRTLDGLYGRDPRWSPDGRSLVTAARDRRGRNGIYRVDVATGTFAPIVLGPGFGVAPQWSRDGGRIYYRKQPTRIVEHDLASGAERDVYTNPGLVAYEVSPDGLHIAVRVRRPSESPNVLVVPLAGGDAREILPPTPGPSGVIQRSLAWTSDGAAVLVTKAAPDGATELWVAPVSVGSPRRLQVVGGGWAKDFASNRRFSLSPDGRTVAYVSGSQSAEVWAVENIAAAASSR